MTDEALVEKIAERVVERVLSRIGRLAPPAERPTAYTSHKRGPHLPGKTRRWMIDRLKEIPGARKVGRDWVISVEDYEAWCTAQDAKRCARKGRALAVVLPVVPAVAPIRPLASVSEDTEREELEMRVARSLVASGQRRSK